jgi:hypothetical protein
MNLTGNESLNVMYQLGVWVSGPWSEKPKFSDITVMIRNLTQCELEGHDWYKDCKGRNDYIGVRCQRCQLHVGHKLTGKITKIEPRYKSFRYTNRLRHICNGFDKHRFRLVNTTSNGEYVIFSNYFKCYKLVRDGYFDFEVLYVWAVDMVEWKSLEYC